MLDYIQRTIDRIFGPYVKGRDGRRIVKGDRVTRCTTLRLGNYTPTVWQNKGPKFETIHTVIAIRIGVNVKQVNVGNHYGFWTANDFVRI